MAFTGSATLDFGSAPGTNVATVAVTGQTGILTGSNIECWVQGNDSTASHNAYEHALAAQLFTVSPTSVVAGTGFTIQGSSLEHRLTGTWTVRWVWV